MNLSGVKNEVSALATYIWSNVPSRQDLSREKISALAREELPWVVGAVASAALFRRIPLLVILPALVIGALGAELAGKYYLDLASPVNEKAQKVTLIIKVAMIGMAIFNLGLGVNVSVSLALLLKETVAAPISAALLLKVAFIFQSTYHVENSIFRLGLFFKSLSKQTDSQGKEKVIQIMNDWKKDRLDKIWACLDELGLSIISHQNHAKDIFKHLFNYINDNPKKIDKVITLFPTLFNDEEGFHRLLTLLSDNHQRSLAMTLIEHLYQKFSIGDFPVQEFMAWLNKDSGHTWEELHHYNDQIKQLNTKFAALPNFTFNDTSVGKLLSAAHSALEATHKTTQSIRFNELREELVKNHLQQFEDRRSLDKIFDEIGLTVGDYLDLSQRTSQADFSSRLKVIHELNDRKIYSHDDLNKFIGYTDKANLVKRIADFLDGKTLEPVEQKPTKIDSKSSIMGAAAFNIVLTAGTLGIQFAKAPVLTGFGLAYGLIAEQAGANLLRSYRLQQTSLFFSQSFSQRCSQIFKGLLYILPALNRETRLSNFLAFNAAACQGETVRDYIHQIS